MRPGFSGKLSRPERPGQYSPGQSPGNASNNTAQPCKGGTLDPRWPHYAALSGLGVPGAPGSQGFALGCTVSPPWGCGREPPANPGRTRSHVLRLTCRCAAVARKRRILGVWGQSPHGPARAPLGAPTGRHRTAQAEALSAAHCCSTASLGAKAASSRRTPKVPLTAVGRWTGACVDCGGSTPLSLLAERASSSAPAVPSVL